MWKIGIECIGGERALERLEMRLKNNCDKLAKDLVPFTQEPQHQIYVKKQHHEGGWALAGRNTRERTEGLSRSQI